MSASRPPRFVDPDSKPRESKGIEMVDLALAEVRRALGVGCREPVPIADVREAIGESIDALGKPLKATARSMRITRCVEAALAADRLFTLVKDGKPYVTDAQASEAG